MLAPSASGSSKCSRRDNGAADAVEKLMDSILKNPRAIGRAVSSALDPLAGAIPRVDVVAPAAIIATFCLDPVGKRVGERQFIVRKGG